MEGKCPNCGGKRIEQTIKSGAVPDTNKAYCHDCEWVGIVRDLLPPILPCLCGDTPGYEGGWMGDDEVGTSIMCMGCKRETKLHHEKADAIKEWNELIKG